MKTLCVIRDTVGNLYGPFEKAHEAGEFATRRWPGQEQDEDNVTGWDCIAIQPPALPETPSADELLR